MTGLRSEPCRHHPVGPPRKSGNTVIVVEHDMRVIAASDWVIDLGPGAGDEGGRIVVAGPPVKVAHTTSSRTASYLARAMA